MFTVHETIDNQLPCDPTDSETSICAPCACTHRHTHEPHNHPGFYHMWRTLWLKHELPQKTRKCSMSSFPEWFLCTLVFTAALSQSSPGQAPFPPTWPYHHSIVSTSSSLKCIFPELPLWSLNSFSHISSLALHASYHSSSKISENQKLS